MMFLTSIICLILYLQEIKNGGRDIDHLMRKDMIFKLVVVFNCRLFTLVY